MSAAGTLNPLTLEVLSASIRRERFALREQPWLVVPLILGACDLFSALASALLSLAVRFLLGGQMELSLYVSLWPLAVFFLCFHAAMGLYAATALHPVEELRRLTVSTSTVFLALGGMVFLFRVLPSYSRAFFLITWLTALLVTPLSRNLVRSALARKQWWGFPAFVIGSGASAQAVIEAFNRRPELGIKPVAIFDTAPQAAELSGLPILGSPAFAGLLARKMKISYAIVASPELSKAELATLLNHYSEIFSHLLIIPEFLDFASLWVDTIDIGSMLGLEVRQRLLLRSSRLAKGLMDRALTGAGALLAVPLVALIALAIRLTSKGPAFYSQQRIGKQGQLFRAWKFRTMVENADEVLRRYLEENPALRAEWEENFKLRNDPRVTAVGSFLRKTSLDELPQLWNVLKGEMSLVGPRPIVNAEIVRYGESISLLGRVKPGLSGLWQVSGRSNTTYEDRVRLDMYYIRNWSVWLDIFILAKTCAVVLKRQGAY